MPPPARRSLAPEGPGKPTGTRAPRVVLALLLAIFAIGALLRFAGSGWGLPDEDHVTSFRSDEWRAVVMAMALDIPRGDLVPIHRDGPYFNWGSVHFYFFGLACSLADAVGWIDKTGGHSDWSIESFARGHLLGRWVSALHGLAAIGLVYLFAKRWYGRRVGLAAALLQALGPLDVLEGHCALSNITVAFWCFFALGMIARALEDGRTRAYLAAGALTGVAISSKLSALPLLPLLCGAAVWTACARSERLALAWRHSGQLFAALGATLVGFALTSPAVLMHPQEFLYQAHRQLIYIPSTGVGQTFAETGNGYVFLFFNNLPVVLGWPLWIAVIGGIGWAAMRVVKVLREADWRRPSPELAGDALCLGWLFVQIVPLGLSETRFLRYLLPMTPVLYLLAARFLLQLDARSARRPSLALRGAMLVGLLYTALYSAAIVQSMRRADPRDQAVAWFREHVEPNTLIGLIAWPSHHVPAVHPFSRPLGQRYTAKRARQGAGTLQQRWVIMNLDPQRLLAERPDYIVYNPMELIPFLRVGAEEHVRFVELMERDYQDAGGPWASRLRLFGIPFPEGGDGTRGWAPATTVVRILERRDRADSGSG